MPSLLHRRRRPQSVAAMAAAAALTTLTLAACSGSPSSSPAATSPPATTVTPPSAAETADVPAQPSSDATQSGAPLAGPVTPAPSDGALPTESEAAAPSRDELANSTITVPDVCSEEGDVQLTFTDGYAEVPQGAQPGSVTMSSASATIDASGTPATVVALGCNPIMRTYPRAVFVAYGPDLAPLGATPLSEVARGAYQGAVQSITATDPSTVHVYWSNNYEMEHLSHSDGGDSDASADLTWNGYGFTAANYTIESRY